MFGIIGATTLVALGIAVALSGLVALVIIPAKSRREGFAVFAGNLLGCLFCAIVMGAFGYALVFAAAFRVDPGAALLALVCVPLLYLLLGESAYRNRAKVRVWVATTRPYARRLRREDW